MQESIAASEIRLSIHLQEHPAHVKSCPCCRIPSDLLLRADVHFTQQPERICGRPRAIGSFPRRCSSPTTENSARKITNREYALEVGAYILALNLKSSVRHASAIERLGRRLFVFSALPEPLPFRPHRVFGDGNRVSHLILKQTVQTLPTAQRASACRTPPGSSSKPRGSSSSALRA